MPSLAEKPSLIAFDYINYKGEFAKRLAKPISITYGYSEYHGWGWLLVAFDADKQAERDFELAKISNLEVRERAASDEKLLRLLEHRAQLLRL